MAEERSTRDRLSLIELLLFQLLSPNIQRQAPEYALLRQLLLEPARSDLLDWPSVEPQVQRLAAAISDAGARGFDDAIVNRMNRLASRINEASVKARDVEVGVNKIWDRLKGFSRDSVNAILLLSESNSFASHKFERIIASSIYISSSDETAAAELRNSLIGICNAIDFELVLENPWITGSWFREQFYRAKKRLSRKDVQDRLAKVEHAIELAKIDAPQSQVDVNLAKAAQLAIKSLKDVDQGIIFVGSLVVLKTKIDGVPTITAMSLTAKQLKLVRANPNLQLDPALFHKTISEQQMKRKPRRNDRTNVDIALPEPAKATRSAHSKHPLLKHMKDTDFE